MKKIILNLLLSCTFSICFSQTNKELYQAAHAYLMQGDIEKANEAYNTLLKQDPDNIDALNDYCYLLFLAKAYPKAIELGKQLIAKPFASVQSYQTLGLSYKGKGDFAGAETLYRDALAKFPTSGVLYNEYGELYAMQNKFTDAIKQWEAGIKTDPGYSNNYYNATMFYSKVQVDLFWVIQYGEIFVNMDSYSAHTATIKSKLFDAYKKLFTGDQFDKLSNAPTNSAFQKAWYQTMGLSLDKAKGGVDAESLGTLRTQFIQNWFFTKQNEKTPFYLFDHLQYLIKEGFFDAYNQWVFGEVSNAAAYQAWAASHEREVDFYKALQQSKLFRQPAGEYYK